MDEQKEESKSEKPNLMANAYALINNLGTSITKKKIDTAKMITIFAMVAGLVVFSLLWKNKFLMILIFVIGLIFLVAEFALESFYLGNDMANIKSKKERKKNKKKQRNKVQKESQGLLESLGLPSAEEYSKQAAEGMFGKDLFKV